ncbi:MAG TPA: IgGFc-binding protein [Candidatus Kapabacteria bacterium]
MKNRILFFLVLTAASCLSRETQAKVTAPLSHTPDGALAAGSDFWLVEMSNAWGVDSANGGYMRIYLTSPTKTKAFIQYPGVLDSVPVTALTVVTYLIPSWLQMQSSGEVDNKAIHIWSNDAALSITTMNYNPGSGEGSCLIPTATWGKDYVVAAHESFWGTEGDIVPDFPSTMAVVAEQDNTTISIYPSSDCRQCFSGNDSGDINSTDVVYPAGGLAKFILDRGQTLQLMPVKATSPNFDLTGTIIHATNAIGVFGGSSKTNIPANLPVPNHVEEMILPISSWGKTYMGTSFYEPANLSGRDYAMYLFISTEPNQIIYRSDCSTAGRVECQIDNKYGIIWDEQELSQRFYSDAPFLCMEYMNSHSYPDGDTDGIGAPAEAFLVPQNEWPQNALIVLPTTGVPFTNYVNLVVNVKDAVKTLFDGVSISVFPAQCIDNDWETLTIDKAGAGVHQITGDDSGVGVYTYGYGQDASYAISVLGTYSFLDDVSIEVPPHSQAVLRWVGGKSFQFSIPASFPVPAGLELVNILGATIWKEDVENTMCMLDFNSVPAGIYFWRLSAGSESRTGKIVLDR